MKKFVQNANKKLNKILEAQANIKDCINIMDEKGRSNVGDNSKLLWNNEWNEIRAKLYELIK